MGKTDVQQVLDLTEDTHKQEGLKDDSGGGGGELGMSRIQNRR